MCAGHQRPRCCRVRKRRRRSSAQCRRRRPDRRLVGRTDCRHSHRSRHAHRAIDLREVASSPTRSTIHRAVADRRHQRCRRRLVSHRGSKRLVPGVVLGPCLWPITADDSNRHRRRADSSRWPRSARRDGLASQPQAVVVVVVVVVGNRSRADRRRVDVRPCSTVQRRRVHPGRARCFPRRRRSCRRRHDGGGERSRHWKRCDVGAWSGRDRRRAAVRAAVRAAASDFSRAAAAAVRAAASDFSRAAASDFSRAAASDISGSAAVCSTDVSRVAAAVRADDLAERDSIGRRVTVARPTTAATGYG